MNKLQTAILSGLARTIDAWNALEVEPQAGRTTEHYRDQQHHKALAANQIAAVDLAAFIGKQPTDSERVMASRAYKALEGLGYVDRLLCEWSDRTAQLRLTPAGRAKVQPND